MLKTKSLGMAESNISTSSAQATAVVTGSFLSGAMMSLSLLAVPVILDTTTETPHLLMQWARMYHYGHLALPTIAVGTLLLYIYTCAKRWSVKSPWRIFALAGATTISMVPFTWIFMVPMNNELFRLEAASKTEPSVMGLPGAKELVVKWARMHFTRSLFPLVGAALGTLGTL